MQYTITKHSDDFENHIDQIAELKATNWDIDVDLFRAYIKWNYIDRPDSNPPILYLARSEEGVIAMRGFYESKWQLGNSSKSFHSLSPADFLIKQQYRNTGLYSEMLNHTTQDLEDSGYPYLFNFNATPTNLIGCLSTGWKSIGRIKSIQKQIPLKDSAPVKYAKSILKKAGIYDSIRELGLKIFKLRNNSEMMKIMHDRSAAKPRARILVDDKPKPKEMAGLTSDLKPKNKIFLPKNEPFFKWRYSNPLSEYLFLYCYDETLKGYLVLQSQKELSTGNFNIIDLEAVDASAQIQLLDHLTMIMQPGLISLWENMLDKDGLEHITSDGFTEQKSNKSVKDTVQTILVKPLHDKSFEYENFNLIDPESWDLKMLYMHDF